tara:strand:- start:626 stop:739 length:114 start_codon:yes stop_codon:yes gene_type:complete
MSKTGEQKSPAKKPPMGKWSSIIVAKGCNCALGYVKL